MRLTLLIDGRSGSGKTTLAQQISAKTGLDLVHLDDFYPGWGGLAQGSRMVTTDVLHPSRPGFQRWDWLANKPGHWVPLDPVESYVIEGVGAVTPESVEAAAVLGNVVTVWVEAPEDLRRARALQRDPDFENFWAMWAAQERRHFATLDEFKFDIEVRGLGSVFSL